ncbi:MAG: ATP-binding protein [Actinomycetota bacterium]
MSDPRSEDRVLVLTPTAQDAKITGSVLAGADVGCLFFDDLQALCREAETNGAAAALITEEVISSPDLPCLTKLLEAQPAWSDLPILVLTYGGVDSPGAELALRTLGNVTLLERPVRITTLVSAVRSAVSARRRQYEIRAYLEERERSEAELRASREQLRLMVESVKDYALFTLDPTGRVTSWNTGAESVFGYGEGEILGEDGAILFTPEDRAVGAHIQEMTTARQQGHAADERWHLRKGGDRFFASGMLTPLLDDAGNLRGYTKVARDITKRKVAEDALRDADRHKDEFLAMLAHELRNPLAPISNALHLMKMRQGDGPDDPARRVVERQIRHLTRLVDDLLDISRITTGKIELRKAHVELDGVLKRAIEDVRPTMEARGHTLSLQLTPEPLTLLADPTRLEQLFANVLTNAAKYTEPGGAVAISSEREGSWGVVRIQDTGIGIAPELLPEVFSLFRQAERSLARSEGGLGIGLTVVKRLVELHGGRVSADSAGLGKGSEFTIRLPLVDPALAGSNAAPGEVWRQSSTCLRVLVVDDNPDTAESVTELLELAGHEVRAALNGESALRVADEFRPHAILLDIGLPGKDGYQVARELRQKGMRDTALIAVSGYGRLEDQVRSREAGFNHHMVKPVEFDELLRLIERSAVPHPSA